MNKLGAKAVTECPICGKHVTKGKDRVSCTFNWEGATVTTRRYSFKTRSWNESTGPGTKGRTRIVCRECAEKAASLVGIERPDEVDA